MHLIAFAAALLALILARVLRAPGRSSLPIGAFAFGLAFLTTTVAVRVIVDAAHIVRPTDYDKITVEAAQQAQDDPDAPILLFVGASFSRNALNDRRLTTALREGGLPYRAINLSLEGASVQERSAQIDSFLRLSGRAPEIVFVEAAHEYDADPVYVFRVAKFSDRAIKQFTPDASYWAAKGLAQGNCDGLTACVKSWALLGVHSAMNAANLGLLATGRDAASVEPMAAYDPQEAPRETFQQSVREIEGQLGAVSRDEAPVIPAWASLFRTGQREHLKTEGVRTIAYYYPPVLSADDRAYFSNLCATELVDFTCVSPNASELLQALKGPLWFDERHLLREGADIYTDWLAAQILTSDALSTGTRPDAGQMVADAQEYRGASQ